MKKVILAIDGMTCSACSNGLEKYLNKQEGIRQASVNLIMANATIEYDEKKLGLSKIEEFVKKAGFKSLGEFKEIKHEKKSFKEVVIFLFFTALAILLLYISMAHMINFPVISFLEPHINPINYSICLCILTIFFILYGFDILKNGYKNLIHKTPNMDTLVSIGVLTSFMYSLYNMYQVFMGKYNFVMNLYFESAAIVIYFIKLGRYIDSVSKDKTKSAISKLVQVTPNKALIKKDGKEIEITLDEINKGNILICRPGEKIAVDGEIISGKSHFDESFITGESKPTLKECGDKVIAGSINYDGFIEYRAERIGKETTISEIVKLVVEASNTKAPIAKIADKVAGIFVPVVMLIAFLTFILYLVFAKNFEMALITFVTILVVACPCSLGLATPLAIVVAEGLCASNGILIKKSEILENAQKIDTIVFDKTGTLTYGKLKIGMIKNYIDLEENKLLQIVGSIESKSTHPIGTAFKDYLEDNSIQYLNVDNFENDVGLGVKGIIENKEYILGSSKILEKYKVENIYKNDEMDLSQQGYSVVYVVENKKVIALIGVNDIIRSNCSEVIKFLNDSKIKTIMLTGDNKKTAENIAKQIGITEVISDVMPADKANIIKELKKNGRYVMMCGDGINDSPALASSNIGVSVNSGTDIAIDSADIILTSNNLESIIKLINISKRTIKNIRQNLFWAFFYNCLMIPIAMGMLKPLGITINPMIASFAMVLSSFTVILNVLRLKNKYV